MHTLKSKGLFASLALSVLFMVGSVATAHANEPDKGKDKEKKEKVVVTRWFNIASFDASDPSDKSTQILGAELTSPPSNATNPSLCSTGNPAGNPCAVQLELDASIPEEEIQGMDVANAESTHSTTASNYARQPNP